jgi:hypothetical protein
MRSRRAVLGITFCHPVGHKLGRKLQRKLGLSQVDCPEFGAGRTRAWIALTKRGCLLDRRSRCPAQALLRTLIGRHEQDDETEPEGSTNEKHDATLMLVVSVSLLEQYEGWVKNSLPFYRQGTVELS